MIKYSIFAQNGKILEDWKITEQTGERDVAYMIYCMKQKINLLMSLEFDRDLEVRYKTDEDGKIIEEDENE